jgi:hypothetical protein
VRRWHSDFRRLRLGGHIDSIRKRICNWGSQKVRMYCQSWEGRLGRSRNETIPSILTKNHRRTRRKGCGAGNWDSDAPFSDNFMSGRFAQVGNWRERSCIANWGACFEGEPLSKREYRKIWCSFGTWFHLCQVQSIQSVLAWSEHSVQDGNASEQK